MLALNLPVIVGLAGYRHGIEATWKHLPWNPFEHLRTCLELLCLQHTRQPPRIRGLRGSSGHLLNNPEAFKRSPAPTLELHRKLDLGHQE